MLDNMNAEKRGYYLYCENYGSEGVKKKMQMQVDTLSESVDIDLIQIEDIKVNLYLRIINLLPWRSFPREYDKTLEKMDNPDFVYIRRMFLDRDFLRFMQAIKEKWNNCRIIIEIPVYPYKRDMLRNIYTVFQYVKELLFRNQYKKYVNRFVTYSNDEEICGVKTIRTMNGVNVDSIRVNCGDGVYDSHSITLIAVATFIAHHGYERIIEGLNKYYKSGGKRQFTIHLVGDGPERKRYEKLVSKYKLNMYVFFHGYKSGEELGKLYDSADAGLVSFGSYKENVERLCTIKTREYLAKGLPVILGGMDDLFENENSDEYALCLPNNPSPVDFEEIGEFLDSIYLDSSKKEVIDYIRAFAKNNVDNSVTLKPIVEYILCDL